MMDEANLSDRILDQILPAFRDHQIYLKDQPRPKPFILGLTGLQGCGKSTLATQLVNKLNTQFHIRSLEISLDDFYKPYEELQALRKQHPLNKLLKIRGQPGTHDIELARWFFAQFTQDEVKSAIIELPIFDKSLFNGNGDRLPRSEWRTLPMEPSIEIVVFEGWCLGFRPLRDQEIKTKWMKAKDENHLLETATYNFNYQNVEVQTSIKTIAKHEIKDLVFVNSQLENYNKIFMGPQHFDSFIHLDTIDLSNVYTWRLEQEQKLRKSRGMGMTDEQVIEFIQGYMPAYELYLDGLRSNFFKSHGKVKKTHLHVTLDKSRKVVGIEKL